MPFAAALALPACGGGVVGHPSGDTGGDHPPIDASLSVDASPPVDANPPVDTNPPDEDASSADAGSDVSPGAPDTGSLTDAYDPGLCTPPPVGIVSWWTGDGDFSDLRGGNHGAPVGSIPFVPGEVAQAFSVANTLSWVGVPNAPSLQLVAAMTMEAWIYPHSLGGRVVDKITAYTGDGYLLDTYQGNVRIISGLQILSGTVQIPLEQWSHVAGTFDSAKQVVYLNGEIVGSQAAYMPIPVNSLPLQIGADSQGRSNFDGIIDEVTLYDRALAQSEIQRIYRAGTHGKCKQ
jgi:hypothetical protein